jgi:hypothetical protein
MKWAAVGTLGHILLAHMLLTLPHCLLLHTQNVVYVIQDRPSLAASTSQLESMFTWQQHMHMLLLLMHHVANW